MADVVVVVVVLVVGDVLEGVVTTPTPAPEVPGLTVDAEVVEDTLLTGWVGDVVAVVVGVEWVVEGMPVGFRSLDAATSRPWPPRPLACPDVVAATRARRESDTASTAHQCGRIRCGRTRPDWAFGSSPDTGRP